MNCCSIWNNLTAQSTRLVTCESSKIHNFHYNYKISFSIFIVLFTFSIFEFASNFTLNFSQIISTSRLLVARLEIQNLIARHHLLCTHHISHVHLPHVIVELNMRSMQMSFQIFLTLARISAAFDWTRYLGGLMSSHHVSFHLLFGGIDAIADGTN